jgi:cell division protein FtsI/penicillin-binding protein 2
MPAANLTRPAAWAGDFLHGDDPVVRQAAIAALGDQKGSVVVVDPENGRLLTVVNQKLAFSGGFIPCSTIKLVAGLAALEEGLVGPETKVWFEGYWFMTMKEGLAISNNVYFEHLGRRLGFDRLKRYAHRFGFGEKAGWQIPGEQVGSFPAEEHSYGIARMTTFGDGISATPLQLAAFVSSLANGGKLYYLQYPRSGDEVENFQPRLKRETEAGRWASALELGMAEGVRRGTGRRARTPGQKIWGKTGTCSQRSRRRRTPVGWFASYNEAEGRRLAVVVMLKGRSDAAGPRAAEVAGTVYRALGERQYFSSDPQEMHLVAVASNLCCAD